MKRIDENTIAFTQEELNNLHFFIDNTLESKWIIILIILFVQIHGKKANAE